ncbi:MAG: hypothetical protein QOG40_2260 [Solirubrobacteraceae bacterium]|nr:hypothetical protein [Solirubrobacteraceae bacterium]
MANRNSGRRGRSRKRSRPRAAVVAERAAESSGASLTGAGEPAPASPPSPQARKRARAREASPRETGTRGFKDPQSLGERPQAPWHPVPVSELLILIGAVATAIGASKLSKQDTAGAATLVAGVAAVLVGTVEFSLREHRSGYRSHTILLALLPTVVLYTGTLLVLSAFITPVPVGLKIAPLALALPLFAVLYKLLRARFADARRERVFAGKR